MQRQKMHHIFCLFVGQMEAQITIGEIDLSFGRIVAAHRDFRPEEIGEIDEVFAYFHEGGFHTLEVSVGPYKTQTRPGYWLGTKQ